VEFFEETGERGGVRRFLMRSNGMEVLLREDHSAPVATFMVQYRVGSRNEAVGHTGATHLLEHMLFKGTPTFNRESNTQIAAQLERIGADFNATTWYDRTNYFETVPSDQFEFAVRLEADRMRNSFIADADRQSEMTVVRNELERGDSEPLTVLDIESWATAFREHPYHHPTIGWRSDVEGVPTSRLREFYDTFYWPNNATAIVAGDVTAERALETIERHFGGIPPSPRPIPEVYTVEPPQQGERRFVLSRPGQDGIVLINFRVGAATHPDAPALWVASTLLAAGRSSRLYRALVDTQLMSGIKAYLALLRDPGLVQVYGHVMPGVPHARAEREILEVLGRLRGEAVPDDELEKARRIADTRMILDREGPDAFVQQLGDAVACADWNWFFDFPEAVRRVSAEDVRRVARAYFRPEGMTAGWFVPTDLEGDVEEAGRSHALVAEAAQAGAPEPAPRLRQAGGTFASRVARQVLDGGATVLALESGTDPTVAIRAEVRAGGSYEPAGKRLLADVTARMLQRGTTRRDALRFAEDVESLGAQLDVSSDAFSVTIEAHALGRDAAALLEAVAEMLRQPAFSGVELGKVKAEIAAEIRQQQESTGERAFERLTQVILAPEHPHYRPAAREALASLETITTGDVRRFYEERYGGAALTLAVVGDVDAAAILAEAERLFGGWGGAAPAGVSAEAWPAQSKREYVRVKGKANADVILGLPAALTRRDPDFMAAMVANAVLGQSTLSSRLGVRVRDREGLTYGIGSAFHGTSLVHGLWYAQVTVAPQNAEQAIASTLDELRRAIGEGLSQEEVEDYKSSFAGAFKVSLATNAGTADRLVEAEFFGFGPQYLDDYERIVNAVTLDEVNEALRRHVAPDRLVVVIAGDIPGL
jgi:zinc protease